MICQEKQKQSGQNVLGILLPDVPKYQMDVKTVMQKDYQKDWLR